jgi:hypothetical protein
LFCVFFLVQCMPKRGEWIPLKDCEIKYTMIGRDIGRQAMLHYILQTEQTNNIDLDLMRVLQIEDSLQVIHLGAYEKICK